MPRSINSKVISANDYYPFGMMMPGRVYNIGNYRYGFGGQEMSNEIKVIGNSYTAEFWEYDPRLVRRWNVDPRTHERVSWTPFNGFRNNPISNIDPTGALDEWVETADGQMIYDNRVANQDDAAELYGSDAKFRANGYTYTSSDGSKIELGDYGFFKQDGVVRSSPDLAEKSLMFTNPTQALAEAQNRISSIRASYAFTLAIRAGQATDAAIPDPSDFLPWKWVAHGVLFLGTAYYISKMESEIETILRRAGGPQGFQYSLKATKPGNYPCYTCNAGSMNLNIGDVWKFGETTQGTGRYSQTYLKSNNVQMFPEFFGNQVQIKVMEKTKIYTYFIQNGHLPPGNKIFR